jgi:hypothetical protein
MRDVRYQKIPVMHQWYFEIHDRISPNASNASLRTPKHASSLQEQYDVSQWFKELLSQIGLKPTRIAHSQRPPLLDVRPAIMDS